MRLHLIAGALSALSVLILTPQCGAKDISARIPRWLASHIGESDGQIERIVLQRARDLYHQKLKEGRIDNPCYLAMDATRPNDLGDGKVGRRFTSYANPAAPSRRFRQVTALAANWQVSWISQMEDAARRTLATPWIRN